MLKIDGKTLFTKSVESFSKKFPNDLFLFIKRDDDDSLDFIYKELAVLGVKNFEIVSITNSGGQADTVDKGLKTLQNRGIELSLEELYIFNIDSFLNEFSKFNNNHDGIIQVFRGEGDHWSFVKLDENGTIKYVTEKVRVSNLCSNGLYYFKSTNIFKEAFAAAEADNWLNQNEKFIAPMYNYLIAAQYTIEIDLIDKDDFVICGTPKEYEDMTNDKR
jgi:dTDP-glucose pyrophosphorylase